MDYFLQNSDGWDDQFDGYLTKVKLRRLLPREADMAGPGFPVFPNTEDWFNFSEANWLLSLHTLSRHHGILTISDIEEVTARLNFLHKVNMD